MTKFLSIKPEHDFVFIKHIKLKQTTMASGVIIAEVNKHNDILQGEVVAVSSESSYPLTVSVGDKVWFNETTSKTKTVIDNEEYIVVSEKEILGYTSAHS